MCVTLSFIRTSPYGLSNMYSQSGEICNVGAISSSTMLSIVDVLCDQLRREPQARVVFSYIVCCITTLFMTLMLQAWLIALVVRSVSTRVSLQFDSPYHLLLFPPMTGVCDYIVRVFWGSLQKRLWSKSALRPTSGSQPRPDTGNRTANPGSDSRPKPSPDSCLHTRTDTRRGTTHPRPDIRHDHQRPRISVCRARVRRGSYKRRPGEIQRRDNHGASNRFHETRQRVRRKYYSWDEGFAPR